MERPRLYRVLRIFGDVREGEAVSALLMFAGIFLVLCAYYIIKPLRDGWLAVTPVEGLTKLEVRAYTSFAQGILLLPAVWLYGRIASRVSFWRSRRRFLICHLLSTIGYCRPAPGRAISIVRR